jgi:GNAT superfamily N-acetyltransferase
MTRIKAGSTVRYTITYLEMTTRPTTDVPDLPETTQLVPAINPPAWYFMSLYDAVGRDYEWQDKHFEDPTEVAAFVGDPKVSLFTLMQDGWPQGFFQLDWRTPGTCDLAYFGMVPQALGKGLGGIMLHTAIAKGWAGDGVTRMTVNTCSLDHPRALDLYKKRGFAPIRTENRMRVLRKDRDPEAFPA